MPFILFEDQLTGIFLPLTYTRPVCDVRLGALTIREKWEYELKDTSFTLCRSHLNKLYPSIKHHEAVCYINARWIPDAHSLHLLSTLKAGEGLTQGDTILAVVSTTPLSQEELFNGSFQFQEVEATTLQELVQLFLWAGKQIEADLSRLRARLTMIQENVWVGKQVNIEAGVHLVTTDGPIILDDEATVMAGSIVRGPFYLGQHSTLKMGTMAYGSTSIGPHCKVGGEVQNVVFHGFSNKAHAGYLGNALIGEWVNLGADTNCSNLKNNYSKVRLSNWETGEEYNSGQIFCGCIIGDHSKTGINTMLNTGTMIGVCANIAMGDFPPKKIPNFAWLTSKGLETYSWDKAEETIRRVFSRRGMTPSNDYLELLRNLQNA